MCVGGVMAKLVELPEISEKNREAQSHGIGARGVF